LREFKTPVIILVLVISGLTTGIAWYVFGLLPSSTPNHQPETVFNEAPMLKMLVDNGTLPPVEERLPKSPVLIQPHSEVGTYGGTWRMGLLGYNNEDVLRTYIAYENLLRWNPEWTRIVPNVAQSYEVNEDATEFTFHLREGMKWSDGMPFTADDIIFWYEASELNTELSSSVSSYLTINNTPAVIEKIDNTTLRFSFSQPYGQFPVYLANVAADEMTSVPMHFMSQFHIDYNPEGIDELVAKYHKDDWIDLWDFMKNRFRNPYVPSLNAWVLQNWYKNGYNNASFFVAERNPYYWKIDTDYNQLPYIDSVNFTMYSSSEELKLAALNGEIDMQHKLLAIESHYDDYAANMEVADYRLLKTINTRSNSLGIYLNLVHEDPELRSIFSNKTFRVALSHGLDRSAIVESVYGVDLELRQPAPRKESPSYREKLATQYLEYNVTLANELLDLAGYSEKDGEGYRLTPSGYRINFTISVTAQSTKVFYNASVMMAEYWDELGIVVNVTEYDSWPLTQQLRANEHDAIVNAAGEGYSLLLDPGTYMPFSEYTSFWAIPWVFWSLNNSMGEEPPDYVKQQFELYNQLKASSNTDEMLGILDQILAIAENEFVIFGICSSQDGYLLAKENFKNVPAIMPKSFAYPTPAPTNPCQYYFEEVSVLIANKLSAKTLDCGEYQIGVLIVSLSEPGIRHIVSRGYAR